jgi:hypothetical protein
MTERVGLDVDVLTIRIPIRLQRRGGRKLIMTPEGAAISAPKPRRDESLIKALVRAHRWRRRIANRKETNGHPDRRLHMPAAPAHLAWRPTFVQAILDGRQPKGLRQRRCSGTGRLPGTSRGRPGASKTDTDLLRGFGLGVAHWL